jgi:hypothetical protein
MTFTGPRARYVQPSALRFIATFGYAWVTIALIACTGAMLIAVRLAVPLTRAFGWGAAGQRPFMMGTIVFLIICSFMIGRSVVRSLYRGAPRTRNIALLALGLLALVCAFAWPHP